MPVSVKNNSNTDQAVEMLIGRIQSLGLRPGDSLGTEKILMSELGLSERSISEAVQRLRALGMLESIKKAGIRVTEPQFESILEATIMLHARKENGLKELAELRFALEAGAVRLTAERITKEELTQLNECVECQQKLVENNGSPEDMKNEDEKFHQILLKASGSPMVYRQHAVISEYFRKYSGTDDHDNTIRQMTVWEHGQIVTALENRNVDYAAAMLSKHLSKTIQ
ncbi:MAG TPA: hypothetical protein DCZ94_17235 [Lentisphaeria bacterium]|nr:MAG: hypothetical protein A2X48_20945 [Lentisphaerae bacterium GWF2_49_21]HBC88689.1 hypothetical protein [Lentisphaeria bacterium]